MQPFEIVLKNDKVTTYRSFALVIVVFNIIVFLFLLFNPIIVYPAAASFFAVAVYGLYRWYVAKKNKASLYMDEFSFYVLAGCWVVLQHYLIAAGAAVMGLLYHFALQQLLFVFDTTSVKKMTFPAATYEWDQFNNVVLRDNILTLDFANNRLIQMEIEHASSVSETQFNAFARQQLTHLSIEKTPAL